MEYGVTILVVITKRRKKHETFGIHTYFVGFVS